MEQGFQIAHPTPEQVVKFFEIPQADGWDPGFDIYSTFHIVNPDGLLVGRVNGQVMALTCVLKFSPKVAAFVVYWVDEKYRGKGYGVKIFSKAMEFLKGVQMISMDAVFEQVANYKKWGFVPVCKAQKLYCTQIPEIDSYRSSEILTDPAQIDMKAVTRFDGSIIPAERQAMLKRAFETSIPFVSVDRQNPNKVLGYTTLLRCGTGFVVVPLMADNIEVAEDLFKQVLHHVKSNNLMQPGETLSAFVLENNKPAQDMVRKYCKNVMFECLRMNKLAEGAKETVDLSKIFVISYDRCF